MADGKQSEAWNHTSRMIAAIINSRPFIKSRHLVSAAKFHPYIKSQQKKRMSKARSYSVLDAAFGVEDAER